MPLLSPPASSLERRHATDRAWLAFIEGGVEPVGVADDIVRSWRRARADYRIDPALARPLRRLTEEELAARRARDLVLPLARPILDEFSGRLGLVDQVLTYLDADGWMLSIDGKPGVVEAVSAIDFCPGASWAEDAAGTNGPGTALAERRPVEVFASEHYVAAWQAWTCAAAPIFAPGDGAPAGIVDITGRWEAQRRPALVAAKAIARAIQERLGAALAVREGVVRYAFRAAHASGDAMVAVDGRGAVVALNEAASRRRVVEAGALPLAIRGALQRLLGGRAASIDAEIQLEAPDAPRLVVSPVFHEGTAIGAIVRAPAGGPPQRTSRGKERGPMHVVRSPSPAIAAAPSSSRYGFDRILGASPALARANELARVAARNTLPVVLHGESGTGKELFAHAIHGAGAREGGPFVAVNCGSIPSPLVEAELFGYEAGTFTGGRQGGNAGRFEDADGGTLFLDEVSELSGAAQTALLRVLQEKEVVRLGGSAPRRVDVRIIAATNKPLPEEIRARRFRRDLFYRLNVLSIDVPPLRERGGDIALLARVFLGEAEAEVGRDGLSLAPDAVAALEAHPWPGNVRELRNVLLRAAATAPATTIRAADLLLQAEASDAPPAPRGTTLRAAVEVSEREALLAAVAESAWNLARAAHQLGISRMTLYRRLARLGITRRGASQG